MRKKITLLIMIIIIIMISYGRNIQKKVATFSIVGYDEKTGEIGVAVQSKFLAVGAVVPHADADYGAVATQAWAKTSFAKKALKLLEMGVKPEDIFKFAIKNDDKSATRQYGIVSANGESASWTGKECSKWAGHKYGKNFAAQGNILVKKEVVENMAQYFVENNNLPLGMRLINALKAGEEAGGDSRGRQSAALLVVAKKGGYSGFSDRFIDIRVDDHKKPIEELSRIYNLHEKTFQAASYIRRGVFYLEEKNEKLAERMFDRAIEISEKYEENASILNSIAWEFAQHNYNLDYALLSAKKAYDLEPDNPNIIDTLAVIYAKKGFYKRAIELEKKAFDLSKDPVFEKKIEKWEKYVK